MKRRSTMVAFLIVGSFFVYCGQHAVMSVVDGGTRDGFVNDANADPACCAAPALPTPAKVVDNAALTGLVLDPNVGLCVTPGYDVSAYREVVVHVGLSIECELQAMWGAAGWVTVPGSINPPTSPLTALWTYDPHLGSSIRVACGGSSCAQKLPLTIVGFAAP